MKNSLIAIFLMLGVSLQAQYKVTFVKPTINGSKFRITLKMSAEGTPFNLGTNNLRFDYSPQNLANPVIVSEQFPSSSFETTTLFGSNPKIGFVSINTTINNKTHSNPLKINKAGVELVTLEFDILNPSIENTPFSMRIDGPKPNTVVLKDDTRSVVNLEQTENFETGLRINKENHSNTSVLSTFPNPTNSNITVVFQSSYNSIANINIYNHQGQIVKTITEITTFKGQNEKMIDLSNLPVGLYNLNIVQENEVLTQRIQKI